MKRAIFVRSKTIVMTELDKKIREKEIYRVTLVGSFVNFLLVIFKFLAGIAWCRYVGRCSSFSI